MFAVERDKDRGCTVKNESAVRPAVVYPIRVMSDGRKLKVFAYYYPWYDGAADPRWSTLREYSPYLGFYNSGDEAVVRQHVEWAIEYGIDGFLVEWFGPDSADPRDDYEEPEKCDANLAVLRSVLAEYPDFKYAIFYDQAVRFGGNLKFAEPGRRDLFLSDMAYAAETNFSHPNYLRIRNRPVIAIYLTRSAKYDNGAVLEQVRNRHDGLGYGRTYIIGDEIWWGQKTWGFAELDAVTAYNLHNHKWMKIVGANVRPFTAATAGLYAQVQPEADYDGTDVIPNIGHAYNDEFLRGNLPLINTVEDGEYPHHREDMIECMKAQQVVWQGNRLLHETGEAYLFITSFNEWPERSVVEPTAEIETFNRINDFESGRHLYLQPHRLEFLKGIRDGKRLIEENILPLI